MALYSWIEQGTTTYYRADLAGTIDLPKYPQQSPEFTFDPFPYLPPELVVAILSYAPADSIPALEQTNRLFKIHVDIYKRQIITIRCRRYPHELISEYATVHGIDFENLHSSRTAWQTLAQFEHKANTCLLIKSMFPINSPRFYSAFLRQWESRQNMFFPKDVWQEALLDRLHIYEDCSRSEICDIIHLQMLYRHTLSFLPWSIILPGDVSCEARIPWSLKSEAYRNIVDHIIACGPDIILEIVSLEQDSVLHIMEKFLALAAVTKQLRYSCFDEVMAKLLFRLDGGQAITNWQDDPRYYEICTSKSWFSEGNVKVIRN